MYNVWQYLSCLVNILSNVERPLPSWVDRDFKKNTTLRRSRSWRGRPSSGRPYVAGPPAAATFSASSTAGCCIARSGKLDRARSRLYRSQILQENMRLKALAEIYTMHSFAQLCNLIFFVKILPTNSLNFARFGKN